MSVTGAFASVSPKETALDGTFNFKTVIEVSPALFTGPTDIVITIDRTYPVTSDLLKEEKKGAIDFIKAVAAATGGTDRILNDVRIGLCCYENIAVFNTVLTDKVDLLVNAVTRMGESVGGIDHSEAINKSAEILSESAGKKAIVMYSHEAATKNGDGSKEAEAARDKGIEFFAIGPEKRRENLKAWVSSPEGSHLFIKREEEPVYAPFQRASEAFCAENTKNLTFECEASPDFEIVRVESQSRGRAEIISPREVKWTIGEMGNTLPESAELNFTMRHRGDEAGSKNAASLLEVKDAGASLRTIPSPVIFIKGASPGAKVVEIPAEVPASFQLKVPSCVDASRFVIEKQGLDSLGRIVSLDVTVKSVCPGKTVAVTVFLTETDALGNELPRGIKHLLIPPQAGNECMDVILKGVQFSLPEKLDAAGFSHSICNVRNFKAKVIANYTDAEEISLSAETSVT